MKTILITGGAGFIGSHLCGKLLALGNEVLCLDNYFTGNRANVAKLEEHAHFTLLQHDITEPLSVEVDEIYNLACPASPVHYQHDPVKTMQTNVIGSLNMLDLAERNGARIFQASTSEVYGDPEVHPQVEDYVGHVNPIGPRSCYDEGKRCAETLFFDYHRSRDIEIRVARIFNTYGPNMDKKDGRVVSNFIVQALRGEDITIYGDGKQTRSFCYVDDLVDGFIRLMSKNGGAVGPINLGNPGEFTMIELAELILQMTNSKSKLIQLPLPQDDPKMRRPDISKAMSELGWQPVVTLQDGLRKTIDYFEAILVQ